jgi:uncharacterized protein (TIGR02996 family)
MSKRKPARPKAVPRGALLALLRACKDQPGDDAPRLVLADWLEERGDEADRPRAERIRLQLSPATPERDRRLGELGSIHRAAGLGSVERWAELDWQRGLLRLRLDGKLSRCKALAKSMASEAFAWVEHLAITGATSKGLLTLAAASPSPEPAELEVTSTEGDPVAEVVAGSPAFARLVSLEVRGKRLTDRGVRALAGAAHLGRLRVLDTRWGSVRAEGVRALASSPHLTGLTEVVLPDCHFGPEGARALANGGGLPRLERLNLGWNDIGPQGAAALAGSPHFGTLRSLDLTWNDVGGDGLASLARSGAFPNLRTLDVSYNQLTDDGLRALAESDLLAGLVELDLGTNQPISLAGLRSLVNSPRIAHLEDFQFTCNYLGDPSAEILAASAHLGRLRRLQLESNNLTDEGVVALTRAWWLRGVERLELQMNHVGDRGVRALAGCPGLASCVELSLWGSRNAITDEGACALAESPHLGNLRRLDLQLNPIGDAGARALLHSKSLARLERLTLSTDDLSPDVVAGLEARFDLEWD